jgi:hypothetical protein
MTRLESHLFEVVEVNPRPADRFCPWIPRLAIAAALCRGRAGGEGDPSRQSGGAPAASGGGNRPAAVRIPIRRGRSSQLNQERYLLGRP